MQTGKRLGSYEILSPLGAGGMGEVYRARDLRLGREVALKKLPPGCAGEPDSLMRLEREARVLATLNHPHVATLYGLEESGGERFLVMELIEGETLEQRLGYGPIELHEAMALAVQIAAALEAAHQRGIVHRDLKPSNVMIELRGRVKLVDFGLSRLVRPAVTEADAAPGLSLAATRSGVILGTAPYMSPEQASGQPVDTRTDVWSFGCLLYEMLTGARPFCGESTAAVLGAILEREPDWIRLPADTPAAVRRLLRRCLRKSVFDRLQSIGDARIELEERDSIDDGAAARPPVWHRALAAVLWGAVALVGVLVATRWAGPRETERGGAVTRAALVLPAGHTVTGLYRSYPLAISPGGRRIAYLTSAAEETRLYVRGLEEREPRAVPGSVGARFPFFSPNGESVGFWADGWLQQAAFAGGRPVRVAPADRLDYGATWGADGTIVYAAANRGFGGESGGLYRIASDGGSPERLASGEWLMYPRFLPDGRHLVVTKGENERRRTIQILDLETGERRDLWSAAESILQAFVLPSGHLIWGSGGSVNAARLDLESLTLQGAPARVLEDVYEGTSSDAVYFAVADDGTLLFVPGGTEHALLVVGRSGQAEPLTERRGAFRMPDLSPDGRMLAVAIDADPDPSDLWLYDLDRETWRRLTNSHHNLFPVWTPDGTALSFASWRRGPAEPFLDRLDGNPSVPLLPPDSLVANNRWTQAWSPDGQRLVFGDNDPETGFDLWLLDLSDGAPARPLLVTPFNEGSARVSPDGHWLAYSSDVTGRYEVYVRSFPDGRSQTTISSGGGAEPRWSSLGNELFFLSGDRMMAVEVSTGGGFTAGKPEMLFAGRYGAGDKTYAVFPDGRRFLVIEPDARAAGDRLEIVLDWSAELERALPGG